MGVHTDLPFDRGSTFFGGVIPDGTAYLEGKNLEGKEYLTNEPDSNGGTSREVWLKIVRNVASIALPPKRCAKYLADGTVPLGTRCDGLIHAVGDTPAGIVDHLLPSSGIPIGDLGYLVIEGPTIGTSVHSTFSGVAVGDRLVPGTGTTTVSSDAGELQKQDLTGTTATLGNNIQNVVGFADAAVANTAVDTDIPMVVALRSRMG
jgi:hypothetical protein